MFLNFFSQELIFPYGRKESRRKERKEERQRKGREGNEGWKEGQVFTLVFPVVLCHPGFRDTMCNILPETEVCVLIFFKALSI